ncbi:MAG: sialidase family protein [Eubacteriales bacterium]|nr:sialidase family protein [Eubacteriales bacterium]
MAYIQKTDLTQNGQIYIDNMMGTLEAVIPPKEYKSHHAPALLELANGDILCAWFAGSFEGSADVSIVCARLPQGAEAWEEPIQISHDPHRSEQNPSLFLDPDGVIWAMYTAQKDREIGKDNMQYTSQIRCQKSFDNGRTWSDYETVFPEEGTFARQPIQVLSNGRWIYGNWICQDSPAGLAGDPSAFRISDDEGKSWYRVDMPHSQGCVHPNVVELDSNHLLAFMRSRKADYIYVSHSYDFGDTWTRPIPSELPNNNSSISALKLKSGRVAIAYNHASAPELAKSGVAWPGLRCPVSVALSEDGGKTFPLIRHLEFGEGYAGRENRWSNSQYEYPYLMQASDGSLHLAFAYRNRLGIKWMKFQEEDVIGKKRGTGTYNPTSGEML